MTVKVCGGITSRHRSLMCREVWRRAWVMMSVLRATECEDDDKREC